MPKKSPIETARLALMRAVVGLRHNPIPEERASIIADCEVAIIGLEGVQTAHDIQSKGGSATTPEKRATATANGAKGGRPRKIKQSSPEQPTPIYSADELIL